MLSFYRANEECFPRFSHRHLEIAAAVGQECHSLLSWQQDLVSSTPQHWLCRHLESSIAGILGACDKVTESL